MGYHYLSIPKLQGLQHWSLGMDKLFHPTLYDGCNYLSMLGFKLIHVSKRGPRCSRLCIFIINIFTKYNTSLKIGVCFIMLMTVTSQVIIKNCGLLNVPFCRSLLPLFRSLNTIAWNQMLNPFDDIMTKSGQYQFCLQNTPTVVTTNTTVLRQYCWISTYNTCKQ